MSFPPPPYRAGIIGTGYAARARARALLADPRARLLGFAGRGGESTTSFATEFAVEAWPEDLLWERVDLVFVCTVNAEHARLVRRALERGLHVVVEYPLALDPEEARALYALAGRQGRLLHVEHIEILSGIHRALRGALAEVGDVHFVRYGSVNPKPPAPGRWTFSPELFGFPLFGALSRLGRLVDLLGPVRAVFCHNRTFDLSDGYYGGCLCTADLAFSSGAVGQLVYAKGTGFWLAENRLELTGNRGSLVHDGERLTFTTTEGERSFDPGNRRGLFDQDTRAVLDCLSEDKPLYIGAERVLHLLEVAAAAKHSAESGTSVTLPGR
jgi:biliverdin reductase